MRVKLFIFQLVLVLPMLGAGSVLAAQGSGKSTQDLRVLIDVSGSMKHNDPHNLRTPALRLLVGLLADGTHAGVWTFAKLVNMQIPHARIDQAWRADAMESAGTIHSRGLFTNIEQALRTSTWNWHQPDPHTQRTLILLTDGMVDVADNPAENNASRQRILTTILPALRTAQVTVHTIALSANADHDLLRRLSMETGGWNEQVDDAAQLPRIFSRLHEKAAQPNTLPLRDNRFTIDGSVREATILVFTGEQQPPVKLFPPGATPLTAAAPGEQVSWYRGPGYHLITVREPRRVSGISMPTPIPTIASWWSAICSSRSRSYPIAYFPCRRCRCRPG